jgi:hypothetical protein
MLTGSYRWNPDVTPNCSVRAIPREGHTFTLSYSKSKRIFAEDVERHLRSMGVCAPVTTSSQCSSEEMRRPPQGNLWPS